ncbi:hypothetical protein PIB30_077335 [Stylosanthes scabra]|uniref:Uncharacterized protein n=1 Tax=Stylosanthes scabra TaxID=79078 RepID=A0ABU6XNH5_9FABA|nr:hypothetical protein [Stylosanthes scabra]
MQRRGKPRMRRSWRRGTGARHEGDGLQATPWTASGATTVETSKRLVKRCWRLGLCGSGKVVGRGGETGRATARIRSSTSTVEREAERRNNSITPKQALSTLKSNPPGHVIWA